MNKERGKLLVVEGIDGAGKKIQSDLLTARLKHESYVVEEDDYPHYDSSFWGRHVGKMLNKDFGNPMLISPYLTALPYMLDEADGCRKIIEPALERGSIVVSNRYFTSNIHQIAKMPIGKREEFANWLWHAGYEELNITRPNLVVVLLVDPPICRENLQKKAARNYLMNNKVDAAEEDFDHQMEAAKEYRKMSERIPDRWALIDCCKDGKQLLPTEVHELVWGEIKRRGLYGKK